MRRAMRIAASFARHPTGMAAACLCLILAAGCSAPPRQFEGESYSRLHADWVPAGTLRLAQIVEFATLDEIREIRLSESGTTAYDGLRMAGITETDIRDGSLAASIVVCCGGGITEESVVLFYVPPGVDADVEDMVSVRTGDPKSRRSVNTLVSVVQTKDGIGGCDWYPRDPGLWLRVLYCEGMELEGWQQQSGAPGFWFKP